MRNIFPPIFKPKPAYCASVASAAAPSKTPSLNLYLLLHPTPPLPPDPHSCGRESISTRFHLPSALINVDTESTPLANPGSPALQMSADVLSAAATDSAEIRCDSDVAGTLCRVRAASRKDDGGAAAVTELARSRLSCSTPTSLHFQLPACY